MRVRQLVGGWAGKIVDLPIPEAQAGLAMGTLALPDEPVRVRGFKPNDEVEIPAPVKAEQPKPEPVAESRADKIRAVLAMADDPDVRFFTFKGAAEDFLGKDTPRKKDDVIAALELLLEE